MNLDIFISSTFIIRLHVHFHFGFVQHTFICFTTTTQRTHSSFKLERKQDSQFCVTSNFRMDLLWIVIDSVHHRTTSSENILCDLIQQGGYKNLTMLGIFTMYFITQKCSNVWLDLFLLHSNPFRERLAFSHW